MTLSRLLKFWAFSNLYIKKKKTTFVFLIFGVNTDDTQQIEILYIFYGKGGMTK